MFTLTNLDVCACRILGNARVETGVASSKRERESSAYGTAYLGSQTQRSKMNSKAWKRIKYWRDKYKDTPNGWALSQMIGCEYNINQKRKKR